MLTIYIWDVKKHNKIGVYTSFNNDIHWKTWVSLLKTEQPLCQFINFPYPGWWLLETSKKEETLAFFKEKRKNTSIAYWTILDYAPPGIAFSEYKKYSKQESQTSPIINPSLKKVDPFSILFVTTDAPKIVVDAAYKVLMKEYHSDLPDGDGEKAKQINIAKDEIYKQRGW